MNNFHRLALKILAVTLAVVMLFQGPLKGVGDKFSYVVLPFRQSVNSTASFVREQVLFFMSLQKLAEENKDLERRVWELENELSKAREFEQENKELRSLLSLSVKGENSVLSVRIVGWDSSSSGGVFVINKGTKDNLQAGLPVIYEGYLVGVVLDVDDSSSYVRTTYHPSFRTSALSPRLGNVSLGVAQGYMPGKLVMKDIYANVVLEVGDEIVTSGKEEQLPAGLVLGKVREIREKGVLKEAVIALPVELRSLSEVFILQ